MLQPSVESNSNDDRQENDSESTPIEISNVVAINPALKLTGDRCRKRLTTLALGKLKRGIPHLDVRELLELENIRRCVPMLPQGDVHRCFAEAQKAAPRTRKDNAPPQTRILSGQDWLKYEAPTTDQYIIGTSENAIVRPGTLNVIVAQEKALKTTFLLPFMLCIATATGIYSSLPVSQRARRVLYLHGEMSDPEIAERTKTALRKYKLPEKELENFLQGRVTYAHLIDSAGQQHIRELIETHKPDVVVFDTWQSFIAGHDENAFKDVSTALRFIQQLINDFGVTVFIAIHRGKNASHGMRGHSSLAGARDTLIELTIKKESPKVVLVRVEPRWGTPPEPFLIKWEDGTAVEIDDSVFSMGGKQGDTQSERIRLFLVEKGGCASRAEIATEFGMKNNTLSQALSRAKSVLKISRKEICAQDRPLEA